MRTLLKILISGALLALVAALGAEVVALHRLGQAPANAMLAPVVVRKSPTFPAPRKSVRPLPREAPSRRSKQALASGRHHRA